MPVAAGSVMHGPPVRDERASVTRSFGGPQQERRPERLIAPVAAVAAPVRIYVPFNPYLGIGYAGYGVGYGRFGFAQPLGWNSCATFAAGAPSSWGADPGDPFARVCSNRLFQDASFGEPGAALVPGRDKDALYGPNVRPNADLYQ